MARRTQEEILAQREAWLARKAAREAGQDVPFIPPLKPGEEPPETITAEPAEPVVETSAPAPEVAQPVAEAAAPAPEAAPALAPQSPGRKRTPEEIRAQREAFMAAKAAKAAGQAPAAVAAQPAAAAVAAKPAAAPAARPAAAKPAAAPAKAAKPAAAEPEKVDPNITRRELLNYAWLASIGLLAVETVGLSLWFAFPNFKAGEFGGAFPIGTASNVVPEVNSGPVPYTDGKFWLVNVDMEGPNGEPRRGVMALFKVCTHLGCLYDWIPITTRFECPCHGSKFALTGDYLEGPARRSLDRFVIQAIAPDGTVRETPPEGTPLEINGDETLVIDTGQRILGDPVLA